jgi:hypothetical protein
MKYFPQKTLGIILMLLFCNEIFSKDRDAIPEDYEIVKAISECPLDEKLTISKIKSAQERGGLTRGFRYLEEIGGRMKKMHFNAFIKTHVLDCQKVSAYLCNQMGKDQCLSEYGNLCNEYNFPRMKVLVDSGANVNGLDRNGFSIINNCIRYKNRKMISYLVQNGADINIGDGSPLAAVADTGDEDLIRFILSFKPKIYYWHDEKIWQPGENVKKTKNEKAIKIMFDYFNSK